MEVSTALAVTGLVVSLTGASVAATQSILTSQAQAKQAEINAQYQVEQYEKEKQILEFKKSQEDAEARRKSRRNLAMMESLYASSGVQLQGSPSDYLIAQAEADATNMNIQNWNYNQEVVSKSDAGKNALIIGEATADSLKSSGTVNSISGFMGSTGSTLLSSANFFKDTPSSKVDTGKKTLSS